MCVCVCVCVCNLCMGVSIYICVCVCVLLANLVVVLVKLQVLRHDWLCVCGVRLLPLTNPVLLRLLQTRAKGLSLVTIHTQKLCACV